MSDSAKLLCGVDIGGTKLAAALYRQTGEQVDRVEVNDHVGLENDAFTRRVILLVRELLAENGINSSGITGIGIGFAGHIRFREGLIITTSNFRTAFRNYPLRGKIETAFPGVPVVLDNDANAQAYGEYRFGAGRGRQNLIFLTVSSGIGAGIIIDGRLIRGVTGTAGEIGHAIINYDSGQQCTCGNQGCLMALSSGIFFPDLFARKLKEGKITTMGITGDTVERVDGRLIAAGLAKQDPICSEIAADSARMVGIGIYNLFAILNPEAVIIGGGLMNLGPEYLRMIRSSFLSHVQHMMYDRMEILRAELAGDSGLIGAAALPLELNYE